MKTTATFQNLRDKLNLKEGQAYNIFDGEVFEVSNSDKVTLQNIVNYLKKKTGVDYSIHYGVEEGNRFEPITECVMLIPTSYNVVECKAIADIDTETFDFIALNAEGVDVYDDNIVFLWSFDMDMDNNGYFVHVEGVKNGILCLNMLDKKHGYSDTDIADMQNS